MNTLNLIGWFLISLPFAGVFALGWKLIGLKYISSAFIITGLIYVSVYFGNYLIKI